MHSILSRAIVPFTFLGLALTGTAQAITFGQPDGAAHPHVGTLLFVQNGEGYFSCTGTLLSPTVMLTAGHCVEGGGVENSVTYVRFAEHALETERITPRRRNGSMPNGFWLKMRYHIPSSMITPRFQIRTTSGSLFYPSP